MPPLWPEGAAAPAHFGQVTCFGPWDTHTPDAHGSGKELVHWGLIYLLLVLESLDPSPSNRLEDEQPQEEKHRHPSWQCQPIARCTREVVLGCPATSQLPADPRTMRGLSLSPCSQLVGPDQKTCPATHGILKGRNHCYGKLLCFRVLCYTAEAS